MDNFQIETAQNIRIQQTIAGVGDRILAYFIDIVVQVAYILILLIGMGNMNPSGGNEMWVIYMILAVPLLLYFFLFETFMNGRTPGKAAMQLRVVKLDGSKPDMFTFFIRWVLRLIDISLTSGGIAVLVILVGGKGQRLGDMAAGTTVISEKNNPTLGTSLMVSLPENYSPRYPQVTQLTDAQIQQIKTILDKALVKREFQVIKKLAEQTSSLLAVTHEQRSLEFLQQIITDYAFYTQQ
ncbi:RDD family protein [Lunatibacter salilacus]|uniref:RDD family protein n=1 Tax=Lunatibacter salilacus TaxID=2483804 RepID=UPI00131BA8B4|nr:RDD family protein [Lunatibacter salilacus]